jgi:hypothetical protein
VAAYKIYWGVSSGLYTNVLATPTATNLTLTVSNLVRGTTYFFTATTLATNSLESLYAPEIFYLLPSLPTNPANLRVVP